jgi:hypothetical protein
MARTTFPELMPPTFMRVGSLIAPGLLLLACGGDTAEPATGPLPDAGPRDVTIEDASDAADTSDSTSEGSADADAITQVCEPASTRCPDLTQQQRCMDDGSGWLMEPCEGGQACLNTMCEDVETCTPGAASCGPDGIRRICEDDGFRQRTEPCQGTNVCVAGECVQRGCDPDSKSYLGCEFFIADLPQDFQGRQPPVFVTVSNVQDDEVSVEFVNHETRRASSSTVAPHSIRSFSMRDIQLIDTGISNLSVVMTSSAPVTVHQFNPENNNASIYSNDASLLLPSAAVGREYVMLGWPGIPRPGDSVPSRQSLTVIATAAGTTVDIVPTQTIPAASGFDGLAAGELHRFELGRGEVLNLLASLTTGGDLSGTVVVSNLPVVVFTGHECANVPEDVGYCDHLEQQLYPLETWGTEYVATKFEPRGAEPDAFLLTAGADPVTITTDPAIEDINGLVLQLAESVRFESVESFVVTGDKPFGFAQLMVGSQYPAAEGTGACGGRQCAIPRNPSCSDGASAIGDPALLLPVPTNALLSTYQVLTPAGYAANYFNIAARTGTDVQLDGLALDEAGAMAIGSSDWRLFRLPVDPGTHEIIGSAPFAASAYGYDCDVSYAYPAGMTLQPGDGR